MDIASLTIAPHELGQGGLEDRPLVFIDLSSRGVAPSAVALPRCPVIGIGDSAHPFAPELDAVTEAGFGPETLARKILAHPHAAAVTVELLRLLPALTAAQALVAESIAYGLLQGSREHRQWLAANKRASGGGEGKVQLDRSGDRLTIVVDRTEAGNAIDRAMRDQLFEAFTLAVMDPDIARVSLQALGRSFSLGADLGEFGTTIDPATAHAIRMQTLPAHMIARCAERLEVHVQGACVGAGLEMAAWAARITATPGAWFQLPELDMGILPGAGGCVSLSRRIGRQRTALMILSGKRIGARTALSWGLVDRIVDELA